MNRRFRAPGFSGLLLASLLAHGGVLYGLHGSAHAAVTKPAPVRISFKMAAVQPPVPAEAVLPLPEPEAPTLSKQSAPTAKRKAKAAEPAKASEEKVEPAHADSAPVDFTGVTLTNPNGTSGWASLTGNGQAMQGPIAAPGRAGRGGSGSGASAGSAAGTGLTVVALASLSRAPVAPALDEALRSHYPEVARAQGAPGHALVRARILADGRVGETRVLVASAPEFGRACQQTLSGSRWRPPLDQAGRPVATDVSYRCEFEINR